MDVIWWSPIDENNNSPPPDGWPEFMMPSQVNNSARAVMGAVRRMYDQMVAGSLALPYVPIAGGTITGGLQVNSYLNVLGAISAGTTIYAASTISTGGAISASGNVSGGSFSTGGAISGGNISASGNINAAGAHTGGSVSVGGAVSGPGGFYGNAWAISGSGGNVNFGTGTTGNLANLSLFADSVTAHGSLGVSGDISCNAVTASGDISCNAVTASGDISCNAVTANYLGSNGNINAAGTYTGGAVSVGGAISGNTVTANGITSNGNINAAGQYQGGSMNLGGEVRGGTLAAGGDANIGSVCYVASVIPHSDFTGICGGSGRGWHDVVSYNYVTLSDAALKTDIGPLPDTLALVSAIAPQAFRYGGDPVRHWGFVAQDVRAAVGDLPVDLVSGEEGRLGLDYGGLTAVLWKAMQEVSARLTALETGGL